MNVEACQNSDKLVILPLHMWFFLPTAYNLAETQSII
jgi:hypothetical protein